MQVRAGLSSLSVQCLVLNFFRFFKDRQSTLVMIQYRHCTSSVVVMQSARSFLGFNLNRTRRKACIRSVTAFRYRSLALVCLQQRVSIWAKKWLGKNM
jgi:hypothetical protein